MTQTEARRIGLRFENIDKRYGGLYALRRVSLEIAPGECVALAGRNGSGKTTLLRVAAQLVRPSAGKLTFLPAQTAAASATKNTGFVAHATMVYDELTAEENLLLFARLLEIAEPSKRVESLLRDVGLFVHEPSVLLLDEPGTGLDPQGVSWLAETLRRLRDAGSTILMSLHGESEISALATRAIRLDAGAVVADTRTGASLRSILTFANA